MEVVRGRGNPGTGPLLDAAKAYVLVDTGAAETQSKD
jgi:hypothetical protein